MLQLLLELLDLVPGNFELCLQSLDLLIEGRLPFFTRAIHGFLLESADGIAGGDPLIGEAMGVPGYVAAGARLAGDDTFVVDDATSAQGSLCETFDAHALKYVEVSRLMMSLRRYGLLSFGVPDD